MQLSFKKARSSPPISLVDLLQGEEGVLDRLEKKQLLERSRSAEDKRSYFIKLTKKGEQVFAEVFPQVVRQGRQIFAHYTEEDFDALEGQLRKLKNTINGAGQS